MALEEDTYSVIFSALKHPSRRKIIRILAESSNTYTELQIKLGVETGFLNYYLESLDGLIMKDTEGRYALSGLGRSALGLIVQVEEPAAKKEFRQLTYMGFKVNVAYLALVLISMLAVSNAYWVYASQEQSRESARLMGERILIIKVLLGESIEVLNTTLGESRINFHIWYPLLDNMNRVSCEFRFLESLDPGYSSGWSEASQAAVALTRFIGDSLERYGHSEYPYMDFSAGDGWTISLIRIRDDLLKVDEALSFKVVLGARPHIDITDDSLTEVYVAGLRVQQGVESARRNIGLYSSFKTGK